MNLNRSKNTGLLRIAERASTRLEEAAFIEIADAANPILTEMFYDYLRHKGHDVPPEHISNFDGSFLDSLVQGHQSNTSINLVQKVYLSSADLLAYIKANVEDLLHKYAYVGSSKSDQAQKGLSIILMFYRNQVALTDRTRALFLRYINYVLDDLDGSNAARDATKILALQKLKKWVGFK